MRFLFLLLFVGPAFAQHTSQPEKESFSDLRSGIVMFTIQDLKKEKTIWLERTPNLDYFLRMTTDDGEKIQKVTTPDAKLLDRDYASRFLKLQYELPASPEGCKVTLRLSMKGEDQSVCEKDDKKTQEILPFFKNLEQRF